MSSEPPSADQFAEQIVEIMSDGKIGLPDPPIVQQMDTRRILSDVMERRPLRPVDSALLWKIIERNSEFC